MVVEPEEFVSLIGPSGCGKSTILHVIAGFVQPSLGEVLCFDTPVTGPGPDRGFVFQDMTLFPWQTVAENVGFALAVRGMSRPERMKQVSSLLDAVGLADRGAMRPNQLSGGMQQRVAIARALAANPAVMLLDEPFRSLDLLTKATVQDILMDVWNKRRQAVVMVTHDLEEALRLSDRVIVLTRRPARLRAEFSVDLPRPRPVDIILSERFSELKRLIYATLEFEINNCSGLNSGYGAPV
jgi:ABC-type nitrate/sulfonate/bicarbonate transport system ATPase subunit